jgi:hypothetical protein
VTPPGIDPGTVRLVAQRLNHYANPGPHIYIYIYIIQMTLVNQLGFKWFSSRPTANAELEPKFDVAFHAFHVAQPTLPP